MNRFDEYDSDEESEQFYFSLVPDEERRRYWAERGWSQRVDDDFMAGSVLFSDHGAELELRREIRLSNCGCVVRAASSPSRSSVSSPR